MGDRVWAGVQIRRRAVRPYDMVATRVTTVRRERLHREIRTGGGSLRKTYRLFPIRFPSMRLTIFCAVLFLAACFCLYTGVVMLLLIPSPDLREGLFSAWRIQYGWLPLAVSALLLVIVGRLWGRSGQPLGIAAATCSAFVLPQALSCWCF